MNENDLETIIENSIISANNCISNINNEIIHIDGLCGLMTKHFYNNLIKNQIEPVRYLELGSWKGASFISAMYENNGIFLSIDNWEVVGGKEEFLRNFEKFKRNNDASYLEFDYLTTVPDITSKYNIYVYNGDSSINNNYNALINYNNFLDDIFIYIKNDWNEKYVREETEKAIIDLELTKLYKKEILCEKNINIWLNGICIYILKK